MKIACKKRPATYYDGRFTEKPDLQDRGLPSQFAFGQAVEVLLDVETGKVIPGVIHAVHFTASVVTYDVAFKIEGTDIWAIVRGLREHIRAAGDTDMFEDLIPVSDLVSHLNEVAPQLEPAHSTQVTGPAAGDCVVQLALRQKPPTL